VIPYLRGNRKEGHSENSLAQRFAGGRRPPRFPISIYRMWNLRYWNGDGFYRLLDGGKRDREPGRSAFCSSWDVRPPGQGKPLTPHRTFVVRRRRRNAPRSAPLRLHQRLPGSTFVYLRGRRQARDRHRCCARPGQAASKEHSRLRTAATGGKPARVMFGRLRLFCRRKRAADCDGRSEATAGGHQ